MVVPPFYDALSWRELQAHYGAVAEAISVPIMYYHLPSATGVRLTAEYVLGSDAPPQVFTGSGDTLWHFVELLFLVIVAGMATIVSRAIDRRLLAPPPTRMSMIESDRPTPVCAPGSRVHSLASSG